MSADSRLESLRCLLDLSPVAMLVTELATGRVQAMNKHAERLFLTPQSEAVGKTTTELRFWNSAEDRARYMEMIRTNPGSMIEVQTDRKDGSTRYGLFSSSILTDDIEPTIIVSTLQDITERKKAEERYRNLFDNLTNGFALHEIIQDESGEVIDYRFLEANPAYERLTGLVVKDILGKRVTEVLPGIESSWIEVFGRVATTGEPIRHENYTAPLDRWYETWAYRPAPGQFAVFVTDISERKKQEKALAQSEERFRFLAENSLDVVLRLDPQGTIQWASPSLETVLDQDSETSIGTSSFANVHPDDQERVARELAATLLSKKPRKAIYRHITRHGKILWVESIGCALSHPGSDKIQGILVSTRNITERIEAEESVRKSEARLREVADMSLDMLSRHDLQGVCLWVSPACRHILGIEPDAMIGRMAFDFIVPEDHAPAKAALDALLHQDKSRLQYRVLRADGSVLWVETIWSLTHDKSGAPFEIHCSTRDIREQKSQSELLEDTQRLSHLGGWELDIATGSQIWTRELKAIHGLAPDSPPPSTEEVKARLAPASRDLLAEVEARMRADGTPWDVVLRGRAFDDHPLVIRSTCKAERSRDGKIRLLRGASQDITEQELMRERFESASRLNQSMLSTTEALVALLDLDGRIVRFNEACQRRSGWSESELVGSSFVELLLPEDGRESMHATFATILQRRVSGRHESPWLARDGKILWISWADSVIFDDSGSPLYILCTGIDITEKRKTESVMDALVQRTSSLFGQAFFDALARDLAILLEVRYAFVARIEPHGSHIRSIAFFADGNLAIPMTYPIAGSPCEAVLEKGLLFFPSSIRQAFPHSRILDDLEAESYMAVPLYNAAHQPIGILAVADSKPMTGGDLAKSILAIFAGRAQGELERHEAEQSLRDLNCQLEQRVHERTAELVATNRDLESFSYSVSHDLRSPLRSINGFAQALLEDYAPSLDDEARGYLDRIRNASRRMSELIDDLLSLSKSSRRNLHKSDVDLSEMAAEILTGLHDTEPDRPVELEVEPGLHAFGDHILLRAVMENLLGNSWKYTRRTDHPRILFRSEPTPEGRAGFAVVDNGAGFDMAFAQKLFGTFQRLHASDEFEGNGIGLATVKRILERHGGTIRGHGETGKGAIFAFELPVAPA